MVLHLVCLYLGSGAFIFQLYIGVVTTDPSVKQFYNRLFRSSIVQFFAS